jgi:hypothetical protein
MKKQIDSEMLPEYDFSGGVRGKYVNRLAKGSNIAVLDKDVQKIFPNSVAVNTALRALGKAVEVVQGSSGLAGSTSTTRPRAKAVRTG